MPDLLLWLDCETTGLDVNVDTVLEVAWCFTNDNLTMLTPLTSRYTNLSPDLLNPFQGRPVDFHNLTPVVHDMHIDSGLISDWSAAHVDAPTSVLRHPAELHRLIADHFEEAATEVGHATKDCRIVLAGRGVSHFDNRLLARHQVMEFDLVDRPDATRTINVAYFQHDVSVAARVLNITTPAVQHNNDWPFEVVACQGDVDGSATVVHLVKPGSHPAEFDTEAFIPHRAADDVAEALVSARLLRAVRTPWPAVL